MLTAEALKIKIIQKAWEDPLFKSALFKEPKSAIQQEFGIQVPDTIELVTLEEKVNQFYIIIPTNPTEVLEAEAEPNAKW